MSHPRLTWQQHELLGLLARSWLKSWMEPRIKSRCGSIESNRQLFMDLGLTRPPTIHELLAEKFKVPELKVMLKERGQPVSGKKIELAKRLEAVAAGDSIHALIADVELTCLTGEGDRVLAQFESIRADEEAKMQADAFELLLAGDLPRAAYLVRQFADRGLLPHPAEGATLGGVAMPVSNAGVGVQSSADQLFGYPIASILLRQPHNHLKQLMPDYRQRVAASLALSELLQVMGIERARRVME